MKTFIPRDQGDFLYSLIRGIKPLSTLEIGMAYGVSSLFIAEALRENGMGTHTAIDPFQNSEWGGVAIKGLKDAGLNTLVTLIERSSHQALPELETKGFRAQFIFVDGSHLHDHVMVDFVCCDRLLDVGGLIVFDDSDWPAISSVIRFVLTNRSYEIAYPEIIIEKKMPKPSLSAKVLRAVVTAVPSLEKCFSPSFLVSDWDRGIRGRCVVLRKTASDVRDSQAQIFTPF